MNSKMVPTRFASLLLCLLYALHALRDSSIYAHEGSEMHGNRLILTGENVFTVQKELLGDVSNGNARKMKLGGRKMMAGEVPRKEIEKEVNGEASKISGASATHYARKCYELEGNHELNVKCVVLSYKSSLPKKFNEGSFVAFSADYHNNNPMFEPNTLKPASLGITEKEPVQFASTKPHQFQDSKAVSTSGTLNSSSRPNNKQVSQDQKDESQGFLEADVEVVNMTSKDYGGMDNPRRKPPINNDKPND
ncbi:hypothetical protein TEA_003709 [Camellia sinensis var. sinensis]|uniref:BURP domain-containing protein n=1 Tax=Camellia sinensis var. sinensis TaxID=542762 RepID=A0A4V3WM40_CAMSN|nr:hypothetical protein TEA_003709 [Camellia sinensis var. sinensis]